LNPPSILDLGCAGASLIHALGVEFESYHGVDISDVAISNARVALAVSSPSPLLHYQLEVSTVQDYQPTRKYDVIVFNEVMYYLSLKQVVEVVRHYSAFLSCDGVILVSLKDQTQCRSIQSILMQELDSVHAVIFQEQFDRAGWKIVGNRETPAFLVHAFRPKKS
jgi:2-polyprenyl-3-methyl-5-hydroxy-6-metoxy-1,4-benzoquinol methylase